MAGFLNLKKFDFKKANLALGSLSSRCEAAKVLFQISRVADISCGAPEFAKEGLIWRRSELITLHSFFKPKKSA